MQKVNIYKPNNDLSKGAAFQFGFGRKRVKNIPVVYIDATRQSKPKPPAGSSESPFVWDGEKITMMLNVNELSELGSLISRIMTPKKLVFKHTSERDGTKVNAVFEISPPLDAAAQKYGNWSIKMSVGTTGNMKSVQCFMTPGEVYLLKSLIDFTLNAYLRTSYASSSTTGSPQRSPAGTS